jgi:hypothetical protein
MRKMIDKKLELAFVDEAGKFYPINEIDSAELAKGLETISKEIATRLRLQKEQR